MYLKYSTLTIRSCITYMLYVYILTLSPCPYRGDPCTTTLTICKCRNPFPRLRNTLEVKQLPPLHYVVTVPINHGMHTGSVVNPPLHSTASGEEIGFALRHTSGCPFCMPAQYYRCAKCNVDNILATARVDHTFQDNP